MVFHGAKDERVKIQQSEKMVAELRKAGKPVDYLVFANEGHSLRDWKNISTYFRKLEKFLGTHLGGSSSGL